MASSTTSVWPTATVSPSLIRMSRMTPGSGLFTGDSPAAAGAAAAGFVTGTVEGCTGCEAGTAAT